MLKRKRSHTKYSIGGYVAIGNETLSLGCLSGINQAQIIRKICIFTFKQKIYFKIRDCFLDTKQNPEKVRVLSNSETKE